MNIGIIVYSQSGHTLKVAQKLTAALSKAGHQARLERLEASGPTKPTAEMSHIRLTNAPQVGSYDALAFGSPVWGSLLPPAMKKYLQQLPALDGKKAACFDTHFFPPALGGHKILAEMKEICESKGATVCGTGGVQWFSLKRKKQIEQVVERLSTCFN